MCFANILSTPSSLHFHSSIPQLHIFHTHHIIPTIISSPSSHSQTASLRSRSQRDPDISTVQPKMAAQAMPPIPRVEILANSGLSFIPAEFVRPESERQHLADALNKLMAGDESPRDVEIPIIDLGGFSLEEGRRRCVEEVMAAAAEWGVMLLVNHGVPEELIERLQAAGKGFFELPVEVKEKYANDQSKGQIQGYGSKLAHNENGKLEWQDYFFHLVYPPEKTEMAIWPTEPADYIATTTSFAKELRTLTSKMFSILSLGLGLDQNKLEDELGGQDELLLQLKINYYPRCPQPELALGVEAHTDVSSLSFILHNGIPGLQVFKNGTGWITAPLVPNSIIVHVGDALEIISNGKFHSVLHRGLVTKENVRISWAVFCEPPREKVVLRPLPELVGKGEVARFEPRTFVEHLERKLFKSRMESCEEKAVIDSVGEEEGRSGLEKNLDQNVII